MTNRPVPVADTHHHRSRTSASRDLPLPGRLGRIAWTLLLAGLPVLASAGPIGVPYSSISISSYDETLRPVQPYTDVNSVDNGYAGNLSTRLNWPVQQNAFYSGGVSASVVEGGKPYWISGDSPIYPGGLPPPPGTVVGGYGSVQISQSFRRERSDAVLDFTYSFGLLQTYRDVELGRNCAGCTLAEVGWKVEVFLNDTRAGIWSQQQFARLVNDNGELSLTVGGDHSGIGIVNPDWDWSCARCGGPAGGLGTAMLGAPYTGHIDLMNIPYVPGLPAASQVEFTVKFTMSWEAYDQGSWGQALAYVQDPLGDADSGIGIAMEGLLPTDNPIGVVPEPGTGALWAAGLLAVTVLARRRGVAQRG